MLIWKIRCTASFSLQAHQISDSKRDNIGKPMSKFLTVPDVSPPHDKVALRAGLQHTEQKTLDSVVAKAHMPRSDTSARLLSYEEQRLLVQRVAQLEARLQALGEQA